MEEKKRGKKKTFTTSARVYRNDIQMWITHHKTKKKKKKKKTQYAQIEIKELCLIYLSGFKM